MLFLICRSSYYDADTADLEIGQEYEDAEAEEEAALELQKASYKGMDAADFGEDDEGREQVEEGDAQGGHKNSKNKADPGAPGVKGSALLTMKNDLEQIALGSHGEVRAVDHDANWCFEQHRCSRRIACRLRGA